MLLKPAEYVIQIFGGVRATARAVGRTPGSVCLWHRPRKSRGSAGNIPSAAQRIILIVAKRRRLDITPADLMYGRRVTNGFKK